MGDTPDARFAGAGGKCAYQVLSTLGGSVLFDVSLFLKNPTYYTIG